ncbi:hypothetical protein D9611_009974 [Ephemerocybe angulata]|uniref:Uncharacterized protein n=1 Tax=Ephemerocybe angulata TaxID=980116 RepID=A0A8H5C537_9AGAR|nr:hypothetical protein D9611_009974 [Tulosesus angulatus]
MISFSKSALSLFVVQNPCKRLGDLTFQAHDFAPLALILSHCYFPNIFDEQLQKELARPGYTVVVTLHLSGVKNPRCPAAAPSLGARSREFDPLPFDERTPLAGNISVASSSWGRFDIYRNDQSGEG